MDTFSARIQGGVQSLDDEELVSRAVNDEERIPWPLGLLTEPTRRRSRSCLVKAGLPVSGQATLTTAGPANPLISRSRGNALRDQAPPPRGRQAPCTVHRALFAVTHNPGGKPSSEARGWAEMEVWAMEALRAAYSLQEFLTVKSDECGGPNRMYESHCQGNNILEPGFRVLQSASQGVAGLGLDVQLFEDTSILRGSD